MRLLQIELKKLIGNKSFWVFSLIFLVFLPVIVLLVPNIAGDTVNGVEIYPLIPKSYSTSWYYISWISSWFSMFILAFVLIYHISNEYAYRTVRQNVIDGLSRNDFIKGKLFLLLFLAVLATVYVFIIGMIGGIIFESNVPEQSSSIFAFFPGNNQPQEIDFGSFFDGVQNVFGFFIQITAYFSFALLLGFLIKKGALAILIYFASFIVEMIIGAQLTANEIGGIYSYFPLNSFSTILPNPGWEAILTGISSPNSIDWLNILVILIYIATFIFLTRLVFLKRDIN